MVVALSLAPEASSRQSIPTVGPSTALQGADCISPSDCWAVGLVANKAGARLNQAMYFNGTKWRRVSTPDPGGKVNGDGQQLTAVSCVSRSDCWAVGIYTDQSSGARLNQALHWNGKRWKFVSTPQPAQPTASESDSLFGIACVSRSDCWAVGGTGALGAPGLNQVLHWNGTKWSSVSVRDPAGKTGMVSNVLRGVACVKASDCWAVGTYRDSSGTAFNQAQHFNGRKWKFVSPPTPGKPSGMGMPLIRQLPAVACPSAAACRAVGSHPNSSGETLNEALRFNGKKWSVMPTPQPGGKTSLKTDTLGGIACNLPSDCWAVGAFAGNSGAGRNQALHWDGKKWSAVFTPDPGGKDAGDNNQLEAVTCASSTDCWAVGTETTAKGREASDEMLHWNGRRWKTG